ncbi:MAG: host attachment protein [Gammaproteobacteria bacterium]
MQYPHGTTIAVTDGQKLRLFRNTGDESHLQLLESPPPDIEGHNKGSGRRHHNSPGNPDPSRQEEDSYSSAVADWLNEQVLAGKIGPIYIVAPPRALGELRRHYHTTLKDKLLGELDKEHTNDTVEVLHQALTHA